jgi:protein phosphatase PTC1
LLLQYFLDSLITSSGQPVPDLFNKTYHTVDEKLSELADTQGSSSGCTAVTVLLRLEDEEGKPVAHRETGGIDKNSRTKVEVGGAALDSEESTAKGEATSDVAADGEGSTSEKRHSSGILSSFARRIRHGSHNSSAEEVGESNSKGESRSIETKLGADGLLEVKGKEVKRVLYTANVGDARAVLW